MDETRILSTIDEVKTLSDPYRFRILRCMYEAAEPVTVKQIADKLGEVPAKIHYHIKKMESHNIVRLDYKKEIKGIIAKYYVPTAKHFDIKCSEDIEDTSKKLILGETQRMISEIYDISKNVFFEEIGKASERGEGRKDRGSVTIQDIYVTEDQAGEISNYIKDFLQKNRTEDLSEGRKKYHCLFSIIERELNKN